MNKIVIAAMSLFMIMSFSTMVSAGTTNNGTGGDLTVGAGTGAGPTLTFSPSPSSLISVTTSATNFTIISASSKTTTDNGIEYGIDSDTSVVYQQVQAGDGVVTATTSADALPSGFTDKAGSAAPTS